MEHSGSIQSPAPSTSTPTPDDISSLRTWRIRRITLPCKHTAFSFTNRKMLRQRRQQAPDSTSSRDLTSSAPATPAKTKTKAKAKQSKSKTASDIPPRRNMQDDTAAELRTLPGRDSIDSMTERYRDAPDASSPTSPSSPSPASHSLPVKTTWLQRNQWVALAIASGACAAFNGVFAKLTTTELTTNISQAVARVIGLDAAEGAVEVVVRGTFFALNLVFNGVMWTLFTRALARGHSATQVSIMNTSTNFVITALLGLAIFAESLPPLWWVGAAMLVAGNVIIGRKDEGKTDASAETAADGAAVAATTASAAAATASGATEIDATSDDNRRRSSRRLAAQRKGSAPGKTTSPASRYRDEESSGDEDFAQI